MELAWKYLPSGKVKHRVFVVRNASKCGLCVEWWMPSQWRDDKVGLAKLRECTRCLVFVKDDPVIHKLTNEKGKVLEVNLKYGWIKVKWKSGHVREYRYHHRTQDYSFKLNLDSQNK
jgi:hypothetical protein